MNRLSAQKFPELTEETLKELSKIGITTGKRKVIWECKHNGGAFTCIQNMTGQPALAMPLGKVYDKLGDIPTSVMLIGDNGNDDIPLKVAYALKNKYKPFIAKL